MEAYKQVWGAEATEGREDFVFVTIGPTDGAWVLCKIWLHRMSPKMPAVYAVEQGTYRLERIRLPSTTLEVDSLIRLIDNRIDGSDAEARIRMAAEVVWAMELANDYTYELSDRDSEFVVTTSGNDTLVVAQHNHHLKCTKLVLTQKLLD